MHVAGKYLPQAEDNGPQRPAVPQVVFVFPASGRGLEQNRSQERETKEQVGGRRDVSGLPFSPFSFS